MTETMLSVENFFERVREGRLTGIKCGRCGNLAIPPREFCECGQRDWQPVPLSGDGTVASYTVIRVAPTKHAADAPYAVAVVKLREGVSLLGRVTGLPLEKLTVGMSVRFRPLVIQNRAVVGFGPA